MSTKVDHRSIAEILLSVSPVIKTRAPPTTTSPEKMTLDPLESLATVASKEYDIKGESKDEMKRGAVMKKRQSTSSSSSSTSSAKSLPPATVRAMIKGAEIKGQCPAFLADVYGDTYNKHGRIGIYSQTQRQMLLRRFHMKRSRRIFKKKIRYGCRKSLADQRLRIKGRFVKLEK